jgi:hypothetical protein
MATGTLRGEDSLNLSYPGDFAGAHRPGPDGAYTVVWTRVDDGSVIACDGWWVG